ncbi:hypothetical protein K438DRAFT_1963125 [Mycena galopus ATCC 62051]|nr:hypothetical protein K438DRAFT_1963125 [Mycena galopus ATCC 62051]
MLIYMALLSHIHPTTVRQPDNLPTLDTAELATHPAFNFGSIHNHVDTFNLDNLFSNENLADAFDDFMKEMNFCGFSSTSGFSGVGATNFLDPNSGVFEFSDFAAVDTSLVPPAPFDQWPLLPPPPPESTPAPSDEQSPAGCSLPPPPPRSPHLVRPFYKFTVHPHSMFPDPVTGNVINIANRATGNADNCTTISGGKTIINSDNHGSYTTSISRQPAFIALLVLVVHFALLFVGAFTLWLRERRLNLHLRRANKIGIGAVEQEGRGEEENPPGGAAGALAPRVEPFMEVQPGVTIGRKSLGVQQGVERPPVTVSFVARGDIPVATAGIPPPSYQIEGPIDSRDTREPVQSHQ